jgi:signal transduction histidine kinase
MPNSPLRRPGWPRFRLGPGQKFVGVFALFILLPGAFLAAFALRVLRQEGQVARQRVREGLERTSLDIARDLESGFRQWTEALTGAVAGEKPLEVEDFPMPVGQTLSEPGGGAILSVSDGRLEVFPPGAVLYIPPGSRAGRQSSPRPSSRLAAAESLELARKDYAGAARAYRNLLASADAASRPLILQRLARTLRKAGQAGEAARTYRELLDMERAWIGGLPSDLIARYELCTLAAENGKPDAAGRMALDFYHDLEEGTWPLEKPLYLYYSEAARIRCRNTEAGSDEFKRLLATEERKLALSRAVEAYLGDPGSLVGGDGDTYLAFGNTKPFAAILLSTAALGSDWWPRLLSGRGGDIVALLATAEGAAIFGSPPAELPSLAVARDLRFGVAAWILRIWPGRPEAIDADIRQRRAMSLAILGFVTLLLLFGGTMTVRIVRRELEIARLRADFVSTVSHEFRSPLTGIRQLGGMLLDGRVPDPEKQRGYFKMIVQESDRLARLVENVLDFSRMEEGRREYRFEPLDPSPWLRALAADFVDEAAACGAAVEAELPKALPRILADPEALGSAVRNLLANAVKYSPGKKTVWLAAGAEGGELWIAVRDEGVGISEEDQKRVFDRFFRSGGEISKRVKGAGLGLSLVKHIVTAHGGTVGCQSRPGAGSTFTIRIPEMNAERGG